MRAKLLLPAFFVVVLFGRISGQQDSLLEAFKLAKDDKDAGLLANKICFGCDTSLLCLAKFNAYLESPPLTNQKVIGLAALGNAYFRTNLDPQTINTLRSGVKKAISLNPHHELLGGFYVTMANTFSFANQLDSALLYADRADHEFHFIKKESAYWKPNHVRYQIYLELHDYARADFYLQKAYHLLKNSENRADKGFVLYTLLQALENRGTKEEFDFYMAEFIRFKAKGKKSLDDAGHTGLLEFFDKKETSIAALEKRIDLALGDSINYSLDLTYLTLAQKYMDVGKYDLAIQQLDEMTPINFTAIAAQKERAHMYFQIYMKMNQPEKAYQAILAYQTFQDSSFQQILNRDIAEYEVKYETEAGQRALAEKDLALAKSHLAKRSYIGLSGLLGLAFLTGIIIHRRKIKYQEDMNVKEAEIQQQKISELEQKNILLSLNSLIEGQEAERLRIAQDLHDGLGGLLTTVKAHFNSIQREIENVKNLNVYAKTNQLIDEACVEVRRIAHDMVPYSIKISGLTGALDELKQSLSAHGLECELDIHHLDEQKIPEQKANMLYRIIQELTTNIVRHAKASKVIIQLIQHENMLHIMVEDNGRGFDINQVLNNRGMGLKSIDSRVHYLNGKINFDSSPGQGTTANLEVPL